jgi:hypothetical protein
MLTQQQEDLMVGTMLGDGNLSLVSQNSVNWRYRAIHQKPPISLLIT